MKHPCLTPKAKRELSYLFILLIVAGILITIGLAFIGALIIFGVEVNSDAKWLIPYATYSLYFWVTVAFVYVIKWVKDSIIICGGM